MEKQDYILFEDYLSGALSTSDRQKLEARLQSDKELNAWFETYREASAYLERTFGKAEDTAAFRDKVSGISEEYFRKQERKPRVRKLLRWQIAVAASVLILLGIFLSRRMTVPSYEDYAIYPEISLVVRGEENAELYRAETAFNHKNYEEAARLFGEILREDPAHAEISLYYAIALVEQNRFGEADMVFAGLIGSRSVFRTEALWYGALSKLKQKDYEACRELLRKIPDSSANHTAAQKLLKRLPE
ncbi:Tetratricopeptide repeat-containing protein [Sinomicrobium oceani]|uniref:Tetratricopeptide repeat-containing protein n=1 Tax=Sinomicrobium oceani TaxID=1150368 RepID=A0A1K1RRI8_9FLAO|nr:tetratricopeptide repeat protein [Sinomicrobium oceani]SFW74697.1 Tetratricopeptide repeat-containing protein [Sinomicrobium oceani]